ncbi:MAG: hypothetical protein ABL967_07500 [Bryobacteraceae bacterium]
MKRSHLFLVFALALFGAFAGMQIYTHLNDHTTVHADGRDNDDRDNGPSAVGNWFGIARPCPAVGDDAGHANFCTTVCKLCPNAGVLPPEVPMMPMIHADGTVTVNDAVSIAVFHTTAQGAWAPDPDPNQPQFPRKTRLQASFIWLDGNPNHQFDGVVRPRFVTYWDPSNPDNMIGYIQPYFFPTNGNPAAPSPTMFTIPAPNSKGNLNVTNHYPAVDLIAKLPKTCDPGVNNCLGTYHFTIHRIKANVPN